MPHPPQPPPPPPGRSPHPHRPAPPPYPGDYLMPWQSSPPPPPPRPPAPAAGSAPAPGHHSDLRRLRTAYRRLRRVSTLTALGYFTLFLLLSGYAPALMTRPVGDGGLTTGLLLGLCQLPVTLAAVAVYEWTAHRTVDPLSAGLRDRAGTPRDDTARTPGGHHGTGAGR
ncbi:DUF485 domain-containing protein [Streptomyces sp. NBC_01460]|uniref:DUF485 domain-containing protein n=1 Tax=Streptomyces sp. NBC_01460 TaxID=2903875 RepID=UPI002E382227|nr:DUF485 domain-containing protein [Streptomyces sp. NBC_01460]